MEITRQAELCGFLDSCFPLVLITSVQILYLLKILSRRTVQDPSINLVWLVVFGVLGKTQTMISNLEAATCLL